MPINAQFMDLVSDLKDEIGQATSVGLGVDFLQKLKYDIQRTYQSLYDDYDWPHLNTKAEKLLAAGSRYYDFPATVDLTAVSAVVPYYNGQFHSELQRGIGSSEYAMFDSYADVRSDPVMRWDTYWSGTTPQFEVWPIPASNDQKLYFFGKRKITPLVDDEDLCLLDDIMVVLFAAARILKRQNSADAKETLAEAQARFARVRANTGPAKKIRMGMGDRENNWQSGKVVLSVTGR